MLELNHLLPPLYNQPTVPMPLQAPETHPSSAMEGNNIAFDWIFPSTFVDPSPSSNVAGSFLSFAFSSAANPPVAHFIGQQSTVPVVAGPDPPQVRNYILADQSPEVIEVPGNVLGPTSYFVGEDDKPPSRKTGGCQSRLIAVYVKTGLMIVSSTIPTEQSSLERFILSWIERVRHTFGLNEEPPFPERDDLRQAETRANNANALESLTAGAAALNINEPSIAPPRTALPTYTQWKSSLRSKSHLQSHDEKKEVSSGKVNSGRVVKTRNKNTGTKWKPCPKLDALADDVGDKVADRSDVAMDMGHGDGLSQVDCGMAVDQTVSSPCETDFAMLLDPFVSSPSKMDCAIVVDQNVPSPSEMPLCMPPNAEGSGYLDLDA